MRLLYDINQIIINITPWFWVNKNTCYNNVTYCKAAYENSAFRGFSLDHLINLNAIRNKLYNI